VPETFWSVVLGGVLAIAGGAVTEVIRSRSVSSREAAARAAERAERLDSIQRDTLLALQEALGTFARAYGQVHHADYMTLRDRGELFLLPPDLSDSMFEAGRQLSYLAERVRDDGLRAILERLRGLEAEIEVRHIMDRADLSIEDMDRDMGAFAEVAKEANERLGRELRRFL
jgi:hypothetical protein